MSKPVPGAQRPPELADVPTYRFWGSTKPPKDYTSRKLVTSLAAPQAAADGSTAVPATEDSTATSATIRMYGPIDSWGGYWGICAQDVSESLDSLPETVTTVQLRINSPGGEVWEGLTILNMLRAHRATVTAVVDGVAASAASFIAVGCDETVMSPGTQLMIHDASTFAYGKPSTMENARKFLDSASNSMAELYVEAAGGTVAGWRAQMDPDTWFTASETVAAGLADKVAVVPDAGVSRTAADDTEDDEILPTEEEIEAEFDLTIYAYAGRSKAPAPQVATATATDPRPRPRTGTTSTERVTPVAFSDEQTTKLRQKLGVAEDADEATILAALDEALEEQAETPPPASTITAPEGTTLIDSSVLADLQTNAEQGRVARTQQLGEARDKALKEAVGSGRITPASKANWLTRWDLDPEGTAKILEQLPAGLVPLEEQGHTNPGNKSADDALYDSIFGAEKIGA